MLSKAIRYLVLTPVVYVFCCVAPLRAQIQWDTLGNPNIISGKTGVTAITIAPDGTPYMLLMDVNTSQISVVKYSGGTWQVIGSPGFVSSLAATRQILRFDRTGTPYIAFMSSVLSPNYATNVMKYNGANWTHVGPADFIPGFTVTLSLALDKSGTPYIAYADGMSIIVQKFTGGSWTDVGNISSITAGAAECSISIDSNDVPYVSFENAMRYMKGSVMKYASGVWSYVGDTSMSGGRADYPQCQALSSSAVYAVYDDVPNNAQITLQKFDGVKWNKIGTTVTTRPSASEPCLALGKGHAPVVSCVDFTSNNLYQPRVSRFENNASNVIDSFPPSGTGYGVLIAYDEDETTLYEAVTDTTYNITVKRYRFGSTGVNQPVLSSKDVSVYPVPASQEVRIADIPLDLSGKEIIVRDALGKEVKRILHGASDEVINISGWKKGCYFLQLPNGVVRKIIKL